MAAAQRATYYQQAVHLAATATSNANGTRSPSVFPYAGTAEVLNVYVVTYIYKLISLVCPQIIQIIECYSKNDTVYTYG
jgi:hypothetical protein